MSASGWSEVEADVRESGMGADVDVEGLGVRMAEVDAVGIC